MKTTVFLLFVVVVVSGVCYARNINSTMENGVEVIYLDYPGFVHEFHYDYATNKFYAFGEATFRQINHEAGVFGAVDNDTLLPYKQPFIDVRLFTPPNSGDLWAIGPTFRGASTALNVGYFLPLAAIGPGQNNVNSEQGGKLGYTFYAVSVESRNFSHVLAYFVGWGEGRHTQITDKLDSVDFVVVRAHIDLSVPQPLQRKFDWQEGPNTPDILSLYQDDFHPFHSTNRPHVVHDFTNDKLFIIDPNTAKIYSVNAPRDGIAAISHAGPVIDLTRFGYMSGSTWHYYNDMLYLGFAGVGVANGTLVSVNLKTSQVEKTYVFPAYYSNPRAIAGQNSTIFIGFEGGPAIIKFDVDAWKIDSSARLPDYLRQVYAAWDAGFSHIYFATYEQHSKVFRIHKNDFCNAECPFNGYCENKVCYCNEGYDFSEHRQFCNLQPKTIYEKVVDKTAAVALGVLFGFTLVVGVIGWVLFYRKTREGYQRVL